MAIYSSLAGSFERKNTEPIEAMYIFPTYTALVNFYATNPQTISYIDPDTLLPVTETVEGNEWKQNLHIGLVKVVEDNSDDPDVSGPGSPTLYFATPDGIDVNGLQNWKFISVNSSTDIDYLKTVIVTINNTLTDFDAVVSAALNDLNCRIIELEACCEFNHGNNHVTTTTLLPTNKGTVIATLDNNDVLSLTSTMAVGSYIRIKVLATAPLTVTLPTTPNWTLMDVDVVDLTTSNVAEIDIWCTDFNQYLVKTWVKAIPIVIEGSFDDSFDDSFDN